MNTTFILLTSHIPEGPQARPLTLLVPSQTALSPDLLFTTVAP